MSSTCQNLFDYPQSSFVGVVKDGFIIVREHWKPLLIISLLQMVSVIGVCIVLGIFMAVAFAQVFADIASAASNMQPSDMGNGRHLVEYMVGSGTTRVLDYMAGGGNDNQNQMSNINVEAFSDIMIKYGAQIVVMSVITILIVSLVMSTFVGAMAHTVAEVYSGDTPEACKSIRFGWSHKWQIYIYQIITLFVLFVVLVSSIFVGIASDNGFVYFLIMLAVLAFIIFFGTVMVAAIPVIIVEGKSSIGAIRRSYDLCKGEFCFIFCTVVCLQLSLLVLSIVINMILSLFPDVIAILGHLGINILLRVMGPVLTFVLYISIRIRNENYTRDDLCQELSGHAATAKELKLGAYKRAEVV